MPRPRRSSSDPLKVTVVEFGDRRHYQMQYVDPSTRRKKTKSTGVERSNRKTDRTEAERVAAKFEAELREGRYHEPTKVTWAESRERYESEVVESFAEATGDKIFGVLNTFEEIVRPRMLYDVTADAISQFQATLRKGRPKKLKKAEKKPDKLELVPLSESTIAGHLAHLRAALQWAAEMNMMPSLPKIKKPRRAKSGSKKGGRARPMKGRPITSEEFERMLEKTASVVGPRAEWTWQHYLRGLWLSGLRLAESLELYWDRDDRLCVDLSGKRPMLTIPAEVEKGNEDRVLPISPEFAEYLLATPAEKRSGAVFSPMPKRGPGARLTKLYVCHVISAIGKKAGVKVNTDPRGKVKYASAHDFRRSFGERWSTKVMPKVLMELMRHESIETTMRYYVGRSAERTADVLWEVHKASQPLLQDSDH